MSQYCSKLIAVIIFVMLCSLPAGTNAKNVGSIGQAEVYFSPRGGATEAIVSKIDSIQQGGEILMQAYSFTSTPIAKALINAHRRGVKVLAVLDRSNKSEKYSGATFLANAGITVVIDSQHAIAHNKIFIFNRNVVGTGSFNFTNSAEERNAENFIFLRDCDSVVSAYTTIITITRLFTGGEFIMVSRETIFSPCRTYRYTLWREWNMFNPSYAMFVGLNPDFPKQI